MKRIHLAGLIAIAALTACSANGSSPAVGGSSPLAARLTKNAHVNGDLLYVLDSKGHGGSELTAFTYPGAKHVTRVHLQGAANGLCADAAGNVYVVQHPRLEEYAHGGRVPIGTIENPYSDAGGFNSCAVDGTTGDMAVVLSAATGGYVFVYPLGSSNHYIVYQTPKFMDLSHLGFCAYDATGNLYLVAIDNSEVHGQVAVLPSGSKQFQKVQVSANIRINGFGGVQWQGDHLVLVASSTVLRFSVKATPSWRLKLDGSTPLEGGSGGISEFWIGSGHIAVPYLGSNAVIIYDYPSGKQIKTLSGFTYPIATAISPNQ